MGLLPPDIATWPSPLNGTSASVTEFKLMVAFMIPVGGHGGDQEPRLQSGPSVSGSRSRDSWTTLIIERLQPAPGASPGWSSVQQFHPGPGCSGRASFMAGPGT